VSFEEVSFAITYEWKRKEPNTYEDEKKRERNWCYSLILSVYTIRWFRHWGSLGRIRCSESEAITNTQRPLWLN